MCETNNSLPKETFVIYDPEADAYLETSFRYGSGYYTIWAKDAQQAKYYHDKREAIKAAKSIERDGHSKVEVRTLDD